MKKSSAARPRSSELLKLRRFISSGRLLLEHSRSSFIIYLSNVITFKHASDKRTLDGDVIVIEFACGQLDYTILLLFMGVSVCF